MTDWEQSETIGSLGTALAIVQGKIKNPTKNAEGYAGRYSYATLDHILEGLRLHLAENDLSLIQAPLAGNVLTQLIHKSGEWVRFPTPCNLGAPNKMVTAAQQWGSAITYARRYAICGLFEIYPDEDDDGHSTGEVDQRAAIQAQGDKRRTERQEPLDPYDSAEEIDHTLKAAMCQAIDKQETTEGIAELVNRVKDDQTCNQTTKKAILAHARTRWKVLDTAPTSPPSANGG